VAQVAIGFREAVQVKEGGIRRPALEIEAQGLVQRLTMPPGKGLEITGAAAAAQDPQHRHQQQEPLRVAHPTAVAANSFGEGFAYGDGLEEADQVISSGLIDCGRTGFGHWKGENPLTKPNADRPAKGQVDKLLGPLLRRSSWSSPIVIWPDPWRQPSPDRARTSLDQQEYVSSGLQI
jgi:hypothetical protein